MPDIVSRASIEALRWLDGAAIANAIETFGLRLRNEGFADGSIRCLFADLQPVAGYAVTARIQCSTPPPVGHTYYDRTDWWSYIVSVPAPRFVVVQDLDDRPGLGAFVGEVHANILGALGCVAYATNGSVRDLRGAKALGFQFFSGGIAVSHAFAHIVDFGHPVAIGGLQVASGDLLFGDLHGLQNVPMDVVEKLPAVVARMLATEQEVIRLCRSAEFSMEKLRDLVRSLG